MQLITPADAAERVTSALKTAAQATGAGFDYLLRTARRESSLNPTAQAPTSSARGLFQFIDQTWLEVLKEEGPKLGLADAASDVSRTASGRYTVADPGRKAELLAMRDDPSASALLAGAFTRRNAAQMTNGLGRAPTEGELYAAHFLGAQGATDLVKLATATPGASAATAFPAQASANRAIFYDNGRARSASEVYARLTATPSGQATAVAPAAARTASAAAPTRWVVAEARAPEPTPAPYNNGVENDQATFHSLFKTGRRSPVSAYVSQAWSSFGTAGLAADTGPVSAPATVSSMTGARAALAYAAQQTSESATAAVISRRASEAATAVTAAARQPKRSALAKAALAAADPIPAPQATPVMASAQPAGKSFDLGDFLRSVLAPASPGTVRRSGRP